MSTPILDRIAVLHLHQRMSPDEREAVERALEAGATYGYGNVMAWLATAWAVKLREGGMTDKAAIAFVSGRSPYPLPQA